MPTQLYEVGKTKVFLRGGVIAYLERKRHAVRSQATMPLQALARRRIAQRRWAVKLRAVIALQRTARVRAARRLLATAVALRLRREQQAAEQAAAEARLMQTAEGAAAAALDAAARAAAKRCATSGVIGQTEMQLNEAVRG